MASLQTGTHDDDRTTFMMPPRAKRILDPATVLVIGARGSGKSALASYLLHWGKQFVREADVPSRTLFEASGVKGYSLWFDGFSLHGTQHLDAIVLDDLVARADDDTMRGFWLVWLLLQFVDRSLPLATREPNEAERAALDLLRGYRSHPARILQIDASMRATLLAVLDATQEGLAKLADKRNPSFGTFTVCAVYDDLDIVGAFDPAVRARFIRALLAMWTSFSTRYKHLSAKIFLAADLFDLRQFDTVDASKLMSRAERLEWDIPSLYRLVLRHLGQQGEEVRAWLATFGIRFEPYEDGLGWMPADVSDASIDRWLTVTLRAIVAVNGTRAPVQRWIANRLRDGRDRVAPRSMLGFFRESARLAQLRPPRAHWNHVLSVEDAVEAIGIVGSQRVDEIRAVYKWVDRLQALRGRVMPLPRTEIETLLAIDPRGMPSDKPLPPREGRSVTKELLMLGMLRELGVDDLLDMPDLFVTHFGVLRSELAASR